MNELVTIHSWPHLERPVLVMALDGWIDAGLAASTAGAALRASLPYELLADFDSDELIDHRARRPVLRITNGVNTALTWPELRLEVASDPSGRSLLLLTGPEPDMRWHRWSAEVVRLASRLGVERVVGLGAFPAPVPHTRPVRLVSTGNDAEQAGRIGFLPATLDVPAGAQGVLEYSFGEAGIPTVGLWARVPHYAAALPYPAASAALLTELASLAGLEIDTTELREASNAAAAQIDQLIAGSDEHFAMVQQLEIQHDNEEGMSATSFGGEFSSDGQLPSGDEIAAELERFLKGQG